MSSNDKCKEGKEKNPVTKRCVTKCNNNTQIRFIDIEKEVY